MRGSNLKKDRPSKESRLKTLGVEALEAGEGTYLVRVRMQEQVYAVFSKLDSKQKGRVVEAGLKALAGEYA